MLKVLHGIRNIGNMAWEVSRAQRKLGIQADACSVSQRFAYQADISLNPKNPFQAARLTSFLLTAPLKYDIFHFYYDLSLLPFSIDLPFLKAMGKKVFFWFCGCDTRGREVTLKKYQYSGCRECRPVRCTPWRSSLIRLARQYADAVFFTTPDLAEFLPGATWLPAPINLDQWPVQKITPAKNKKIRIAHAPTSQALKGTRYLKQAIEELKRKGHDIELVLIENMDHDKIREVVQSVDLTVDQLLIGAYGIFSAEMMALGKPVICYLRDDIRKMYPADLPIISAHPGNLAAVLEKTIKQRKEWPKLGQQGRAYAENVHDVTKITKKLMEYY